VPCVTLSRFLSCIYGHVKELIHSLPFTNTPSATGILRVLVLRVL